MFQTHDVHGNAYAKLSELKEGDFVLIDGGFSCLSQGKAQVRADDSGRLFIPCSSGNHYLDGQADDGEHCVGIYGPL